MQIILSKLAQTGRLLRDVRYVRGSHFGLHTNIADWNVFMSLHKPDRKICAESSTSCDPQFLKTLGCIHPVLNRSNITNDCGYFAESSRTFVGSLLTLYCKHFYINITVMILDIICRPIF
jgi:hypothetical protein